MVLKQGALDFRLSSQDARLLGAALQSVWDVLVHAKGLSAMNQGIQHSAESRDWRIKELHDHLYDAEEKLHRLIKRVESFGGNG